MTDPLLVTLSPNDDLERLPVSSAHHQPLRLVSIFCATEMPTSPIQLDLENIFAKQQTEIQKRPTSKLRQRGTADDKPAGTAQEKPLMRPPPLKPNMLNEQMAKEAAKTFKKKEKRIQAACAAVDAGQPIPPSPDKQACCIIL